MRLRSLKSGKRGDVTDIVVWLIIIFIMVTGFFLYAFIIPQITDGLKAGGLNASAEGANAIDSLESFGTVTIQRGVFLLFMGLIIGNLISAFLVRTHPIFIFLYVFSLGLAALLGTYFANAYDLIRQNPLMADTLASQTLMNLVMENLVLITIVVGILSIIIVFAKFSSGGRPAQGQLL